MDSKYVTHVLEWEAKARTRKVSPQTNVCPSIRIKFNVVSKFYVLNCCD